MSAWETIGKSDEWMTPKYVFDALGCSFDMDVAAPPGGPRYVPCAAWLHERSLDLAWKGFVWMNPPFGGRNGLRPWLGKFMQHSNGIALTPDRTSAPWFQEFAREADALLFVRHKIQFERADGSVGKQPGTGTALWASGKTAVWALKNASLSGLGQMVLPI